MILDGQKVASEIQQLIASKLGQTKQRPGLAFILVGDNPASRTYIRMKKKACSDVGILSFDREFPAAISEEELLKAIDHLNRDPKIHGILVQLPLPPHISPHRVMEAVSPKKDVDGFHPLNVGKMLLGETDGFFPCTPFGIIQLLQRSHISVSGKHVVIVGRSNIVGKPLAAMLVQKAPGCNATVTVAHSFTNNLPAVCRTADILVAAMGKPKFITPDMVQKGAVVIDVGINRVGMGKKIVGDVDFEAVAPLCSHITPVPGGIGPMTIAMLLSNTLLAYERSKEIFMMDSSRS